VVIAAPIAVRRLWPLPAFVAVLTASVLAVLSGMTTGWFAAAAFCLYPVALTRNRRSPVHAGITAAAGALVLLSLSLIGTAEPDRLSSPSGQFAIGLLLMGGAWVIGQATRERRQYVARAVREQAERAVSEERLRIAREMHDVVAHSMSIITVKAGVANHVLGSHPEQAHEALTVIESTSRQALTELRRMLGVLRSAPPDERAPLEPSQGIDRLPDLVERSRLAGLPVELEVSAVPPLPDGVDQAIYRIVQESLTNVVKHARASACKVVIRGDGGQVIVEVANSRGAGGAAGSSPPHGLIGMRERVAAYGGTLETGPDPAGGFRVHACIPIEGPEL
jgi:signal transduction histidine kinase